VSDLENRKKLDDEDIDIDDILEGLEDDLLDEEDDRLPKSRVTEIVKKRLAREKSRYKNLMDELEEFKSVYGVTPREAIEFGKRERQKYAFASSPLGAQTAAQQPSGAVKAPPLDIPSAPVAVDPIARQKALELEEWKRRAEEERRREAEAMEFVREFPNVKLEDIPQEVWQRRAAGGVSLAEAYKIVTANRRAAEAAKVAAEKAARDAAERRALRTEGADFSGGTSEAGSLTDEEREFARVYGMTPKEYAAYKQKVQKLREELKEEGY